MEEIRKIQISRPDLGDEEWEALREPVLSGWVTQGPKVRAFEEAFAARQGVEHALATTSCTTVLHLILAALGVGPGDEVIVPAFTWVASANAVEYCGARPVFVDVSAKTFNIDPADVAARVTRRTKAIIAVHLFGLCADMSALAEAAPGVPIVEDAACAVGGAYRGEQAGALGIAAAFSFHPRKIVTTGEGGMVTTRSAELAERMTIMRNHGATVSEEQRHHGPKPYILPDFPVMGFNYRMTDIQGALGLVQLGKLDRLLAERVERAAFYTERLGELEWLNTPDVPDDCTHGWQSYVCLVDEERSPMSRNDLMEALEARGVSTRPGTHAVHTLTLYREKYGIAPNDYPGALLCDRASIAIPLHNRMTEEDYEYVASTLFELNTVRS